MLNGLPSLLRDEPGLTRALGDPSARIAVVEVARPMAIAALAQLSGRRPLVVACPTRCQRRSALRRPHPVHARRRRRPLPGVGDTAVRAREPQCRDDGAAARSAVAAAQPRPHPGDRRRRRARTPPEVGTRRDDHRADRRPAERDRRPRRAHRDTRRLRLPARGAGRAPRRVRPAGGDRRRLPVDRQRAGPHRPVGRRGGPPDALRRQRPALDRRPRRGGHLPRPRADTDGGCQPPGRRVDRRRAVGTRAVGAARRGRSTSTAWSRGSRGSSTRTSCSPTCCQSTPRSCCRAAPDARPGDRAARRGGRPRQGARLDVGARSRQGVPAPARVARCATGFERVVLDDRLDAGLTRHARRRGLRLGPGRR